MISVIVPCKKNVLISSKHEKTILCIQIQQTSTNSDCGWFFIRGNIHHLIYLIKITNSETLAAEFATTQLHLRYRVIARITHLIVLREAFNCKSSKDRKTERVPCSFESIRDLAWLQNLQLPDCICETALPNDGPPIAPAVGRSPGAMEISIIFCQIRFLRR